MNFWVLIAAIVAATFPMFSGSAQVTQPEPAYDNLSSPVDLVSSYYNAINLQDYPRAYAYWQSAPNSYSDFVSGFAQTEQVQLIIQPAERIGIAAGSQYVEIPTVLIASQSDGSNKMFVGCFTTRKSNLQASDVPEESLIWHLYSADLAEVALTASIPTLLAEACDSQ